MLYDYSKINHYKRAQQITNKVYIIAGDKTLNAFKKAALKLNGFINNSMIFFMKNTKHFVLTVNSRTVANIIEK